MRFFLYLTIALLASCSNNQAVKDNTPVHVNFGAATATGALLPAGQVPSNIERITIQAISSSKAPLTPVVSMQKPNFNTTLTVPNGKDIRIVAKAYDAAHEVIYIGISSAYTFTGKPLTVPIVFNMNVVITAPTTATLPNSKLTLTAKTAGIAPTATSPLVWKASGGIITPVAGSNGGQAIWKAPNTPGDYTITAYVDPAANPDQDSTLKGFARITVTPLRGPVAAPVIGANTPEIFYDFYGNPIPSVYTSTLDIYGFAPLGSLVDIYASDAQGNTQLIQRNIIPSSNLPLPAGIGSDFGDFAVSVQLPSNIYNLTAYAHTSTATSPVSNSVPVAVNALYRYAQHSSNTINGIPRDGHFIGNDIIVGTDTGNIYIYPYNQQGLSNTPTTLTTGITIHRFATGLLNADLYTDLAIPDATNNAITVFWGSSAGFSPYTFPADPYTEPYDATIAYINNDAYTDIITANFSSTAGVSTGNTVSLFTGSTSAGLPFQNNTPITITGAQGLNAIIAEDLNYDFYTDIITLDNNGNIITIINNNTVSFTPQIVTPAVASCIAVGTLGLFDLYPDIVACNKNSNSISVLLNGYTLNNPTASFPTAANYNLSGQPVGIAIANLTADPYADIIVAEAGTKSLAVLLGNADGTFRPAIRYPIVDANGIQQGNPTFIVVDTASRDIIVGNDNGSISLIPYAAIPSGPQ